MCSYTLCMYPLSVQYSASVVVIMDNHFNPSVSNQCISRAHRLGQKKPVYCFRLAMENTLETKIYARSVNKEGVAMQVLDGKFSAMLFKKDELNDLQGSNNIMVCDVCKKRRLVDQLPSSEDGEWRCEMNSDKIFNSCKIPMQPGLEKKRRGPKKILNNPILKHVTEVINTKTRRTALVLDYIPVQMTHETDSCCEDAINKLKEEISGVCQHKIEKELSPAKKSTKEKGKAIEGDSEEAIVQYNETIIEATSGNRAERKSKDTGGEIMKESSKKLITNSTTATSKRNFPDIISVSSSEDDIENNHDQPLPCKKTFRPNNHEWGNALKKHPDIRRNSAATKPTPAQADVVANSILNQQQHGIHYQGQYSGIHPQDCQMPPEHGNMMIAAIQQQQQQRALQSTLHGITPEQRALMTHQQQFVSSGGLTPSNCYNQYPSVPHPSYRQK